MRRLFIIVLSFVCFLFFYIFLSVSPPKLYAAGDKCGFTILPHPSVLMTDTYFEFVFILPEDISLVDSQGNDIYYSVKTEYKSIDPLLRWSGDYIMKPQKANRDPQFNNAYVIRGLIDKNNYSLLFTLNKGHKIGLYRLIDQSPPIDDTSKAPAWESLKSPYCEKTYDVVRELPPIPTPINVVCSIIASPKTPDINTPMDITVNLDTYLPYDEDNYYSIDLTVSTWPGMKLYDNRKKSYLEPLHHGSVDSFLSKESFGAFNVAGTYVADFSVGKYPPAGPINQILCKRSVYITVASPGQKGSIKYIIPSPIVLIPTKDPIYCGSNCYNEKLCLDDTDEIDCIGCYQCRAFAQQRARFDGLCTNLSTEVKSENEKSDQQTCLDCVHKGGYIWTAVGCISTDPVFLINETFLGVLGLGIAGGVAFLYFLYGAFLILTSMGNPEQINQGKEIMVSSISGLLLILFSVFILRVVGVDILRIPDLGPVPPTPTP